MKKLVALAGLLVLGGALGLVLTTHGSDHPSSPAASPAQTRSTRSPRFVPIVDVGPPGTTGPKYFGFIAKVDASTHTIYFDRARWLSGKAAQRAAQEDGVLEPGEPVSNDYYIRNRDRGTQALKVWPGASIIGATPATALRPNGPPQCGRCSGGWGMSLDEFFAAWQGKGSGPQGAYWITLWKGRVAVIQEQYRP